MMCSKAVFFLLLIILVLLFLSWCGISVDGETGIRGFFQTPIVKTFALPSFQFSFPLSREGETRVSPSR